MAWPGFEPMTSRSEVHYANHYTIEASYNKGQIFYVEVYDVLLFCEVKIEMHVTYNEWILGKLIFILILHLYFFSECKKCDDCDCKENQKESCDKTNGKCVCKSEPTSGSSATFTFNKTIVLFTIFLIFLSHQFWIKEIIW